MPTGYILDYRFCLVQVVSKGEFVGDGTAHVVGGADWDVIEIRQYVHFSQGQLVSTLHADAIAGGHHVERADPSGPPGSGSVFAARFPQGICLFAK